MKKIATVFCLLVLAGCGPDGEGEEAMTVPPSPTVQLAATTAVPPAYPAPTTAYPPPAIPTPDMPYLPPATITPSPTRPPSPTPNPFDLPSEARGVYWSEAEDVSPNGQWRVMIDVSDPMPPEDGEAGQFPNRKYYVEMVVARMDGSQSWTAVGEWRAWGLGYTAPQPVRWSADGRFFYFANVPIPDGCSLLTNGGDLWRLDLATGKVTEIAPYIGLVMALSPDETKLAVNASYGRGFLIRDLTTEEEQPIPLPQPDEQWQISGLQWSPDGRHLLILQAVKPCSPETETVVARVDVAELTAAAILEPDMRNFTLLEWVRNDQVQLQDEEGDIWYLNPFSLEMTKGDG
ncbi:MAG: TolB family protein [Anaerolineae bacterium]